MSLLLHKKQEKIKDYIKTITNHSESFRREICHLTTIHWECVSPLGLLSFFARFCDYYLLLFLKKLRQGRADSAQLSKKFPLKHPDWCMLDLNLFSSTYVIKTSYFTQFLSKTEQRKCNVNERRSLHYGGLWRFDKFAY